MEKSGEEIYQEEKVKAQALYDTLGGVRCPALRNETVNFTSEGFNHLIFKKGILREKSDQMGRFKCLEFVKSIVEASHTIQEQDEKLQEVRVRRHKLIARETKTVRYWGFIAIMRRKRVKVVVKKIGNGQIIFWSIIPLWHGERFGNFTRRDLTTADLEEE